MTNRAPTGKLALLLRCLADHHGRVVSYDLATQRSHATSRESLGALVSRLRRYLTETKNEHEILTYSGQGYMLRRKERYP